ncbi:PEGA domain-containing protein [Stigmatella sp. ncwal1]|uniref:PEGA domain-containing protein n=1 Tax=Stigmatella ashevillensis TaxID=2995309 RepID=A0ABT5DR04_9BACT|nr:PEGA domain-containing protein [Stigmatella ashevillena]MDC0714811.1 PEGA domain-containing protein [Stigmatella ashevillena]
MPLARLLLVLALVLGVQAEAQSSRRAKAKKPAASKRVPPPAPTAVEPAPLTPTPSPPEPAPATVVTPVPSGPRTAVFAAPRQGASSKSAEALQEELSRLLAAKPDVALVDLATVFPRPAPASFQEADALFEEGKGLYDNLDPEAAAGKFLEAVEAYQKFPAELKPEQLAKAFIFLGAAQLLNGEPETGKRSFLRAISTYPAIQPDSELFGADVQTAFTDMQQEFSRQPPGTLLVDSVPRGARVTVDGKDVGVTPLPELKLHAGRHPVVISRPGYQPVIEYPQLSATKNVELKPQLALLPEMATVVDAVTRATSEQGFNASALPPEVASLGERLGARYVVLAAVSEKKGRVGAEVQVWDVQTKGRLRGVQLDTRSKKPSDSVEGAAQRIHGFLVGGPLTASPAGAPTASSLVKKPWFWAAVVGGAAVVTGGIFYATQADKGRPGGVISGFPGLGF